MRKFLDIKKIFEKNHQKISAVAEGQKKIEFFQSPPLKGKKKVETFHPPPPPTNDEKKLKLFSRRRRTTKES